MKLKPLIAVLALVAGAAHADYGDMHLYVRGSVYGPETLRITEIDSVTMKVQQCDQDGIGCGQANDFKRPNSKAKTWSLNASRQSRPDSITLTAKGNIIFSTTPLSFIDDPEANKESILCTVYFPR